MPLLVAHHTEGLFGITSWQCHVKFKVWYSSSRIEIAVDLDVEVWSGLDLNLVSTLV